MKLRNIILGGTMAAMTSFGLSAPIQAQTNNQDVWLKVLLGVGVAAIVANELDDKKDKRHAHTPAYQQQNYARRHANGKQHTHRNGLNQARCERGRQKHSRKSRAHGRDSQRCQNIYRHLQRHHHGKNN